MKKELNIEITRDPIAFIPDIVYAQEQINIHTMNIPMTLDLMVPMSGKKAPLLVWLEGGAWRTLDTRFGIPELTYLVEAGFAVAVVKYRLSNTGGFPVSLQDAKSAIRYLKANADKYFLDVSKVGLIGRSAGATMAAQIANPAMRVYDKGDYLDQTSDIDAAVCMYAIYNFFTYNVAMEETHNDQFIRNVADHLYGAPEENPELATKASPQLMLDGSPVAPQLLLHGTKDPTVPYAQSVDYYNALIENGSEADLVLLNGAGHGTVEFDQPEVKGLILEFFQKHILGK